jgi:DNA repair photolyase
MTNHPADGLFFLGPRLPTSRDVARRVALGGADALTDATRRADSARYQEVQCRTALNRAEGMPFQWTLNPYRGCTHACHYCFARRYHAQFELDAGDQFSSVILVKKNVADVLAREIDRPSWRGELVALGTATDAYQPIEGHYRLTRASLEVFAKARTPVAIVTKGPMIVRDADILRAIAGSAGCTVYLSVPTVDDAVWQALEPGTAPPMQRLRAVRALVDAGVPAGVLLAPLVPGFSSAPRQVERTMAAIADHGARFVACSVMHLQPAVRQHFLTFVERHFPDRLCGLERLYGRTYAPRSYRLQVQSVFSRLKRRYGLTDGPPARPASPARADQTAAPARQSAFQW